MSLNRCWNVLDRIANFFPMMMNFSMEMVNINNGCKS